jgi:hypothetical protein
VEVVQDNKSCACLGLMDCHRIPAMVQQLLLRVNSNTTSAENHVDAMDTIGVYDSEQYQQFLHQAVSVAKIDFEAHGCEHHAFEKFTVPNLKCKKSWHQ